MIALVTGANRGIGREVARQLFADHGATVIVAARDPVEADRVARELDPSGTRAWGLTLDVASDDTVRGAANRVASRIVALDVLVNNAGANYDYGEQAVSLDLATAHRTLEVNLYGAWRCAQAFAPLLRASGHGRLVNVSSGAGSVTDFEPSAPAYSISKAALNMLTLYLAAELRPDGVLVNAVSPGWVATDMGGGEDGGGRPVTDGARGIVWAATLPDDGPTGGFFQDGKPFPW